MNLDDATVLQRYKRALADARPEHDKLVADTEEFYEAYGLNSIGGADFADLSKVWGKNPPEIGMMLSNVNTFWGQLVASRREPTFPGFDQSPEDEVIGEMLTMLLKAGRRWANSDAADEEALMDAVVTGYGFAEDFLETESRPPFRPDDQYIPLSDLWWEAGNEKNLKDSREFIRRHRYSIDEAAARFAEHEDAIRAMGQTMGSGADAAGAIGEGARGLGGPAISVSVNEADGSNSRSSKSRRLREIPVDDFQFVAWEQLASWEMPAEPGSPPVKIEGRVEDFTQAMGMLEQQAVEQGQPFQRPEVVTYTQATWFRARILAQSAVGEPKVLVSAAPIPGNQPLIKAMTGYPERYMDGDVQKTRYFGFGRVLLGLQRLVSVAIRVYIEQEARRNRSGGDIEDDAFDSPAALQAWVDAKAVPGSFPKIPPGAFDKIHYNPDSISPHVSSMQGLFQFLAVDLVGHMLGISNITRGTFEGDRSAKFLATMQETSIQMQTRYTTSFTDYLQKGSVTMARLLLLNLDAQDIDRLLGKQPLRDGITGQKNPETGELEPMLDEAGEPITVGRFLKERVGEIFDQDISFGLRPSAASERMANAMLMTQHGFLETIAKLVPDAGDILAPAALKGSFAQGTIFADVADQLEAHIKKRKEQQGQQAAMATDQGWVQFIANMAKSDFDKAAGLMQQATEAVSGPQQGGEQQVQ